MKSIIHSSASSSKPPIIETVALLFIATVEQEGRVVCSPKQWSDNVEVSLQYVLKPSFYELQHIDKPVTEGNAALLGEATQTWAQTCSGVDQSISLASVLNLNKIDAEAASSDEVSFISVVENALRSIVFRTVDKKSVAEKEGDEVISAVVFEICRWCGRNIEEKERGNLLAALASFSAMQWISLELSDVAPRGGSLKVLSSAALGLLLTSLLEAAETFSAKEEPTLIAFWILQHILRHYTTPMSLQPFLSFLCPKLQTLYKVYADQPLKGLLAGRCLQIALATACPTGSLSVQAGASITLAFHHMNLFLEELADQMRWRDGRTVKFTLLCQLICVAEFPAELVCFHLTVLLQNYCQLLQHNWEADVQTIVLECMRVLLLRTSQESIAWKAELPHTIASLLQLVIHCSSTSSYSRDRQQSTNNSTWKEDLSAAKRRLLLEAVGRETCKRFPTEWSQLLTAALEPVPRNAQQLEGGGECSVVRPDEMAAWDAIRQFDSDIRVNGH